MLWAWAMGILVFYVALTIRRASERELSVLQFVTIITFVPIMIGAGEIFTNFSTTLPFYGVSTIHGGTGSKNIFGFMMALFTAVHLSYGLFDKRMWLFGTGLIGFFFLVVSRSEGAWLQFALSIGCLLAIYLVRQKKIVVSPRRVGSIAMIGAVLLVGVLLVGPAGILEDPGLQYRLRFWETWVF